MATRWSPGIIVDAESDKTPLTPSPGVGCYVIATSKLYRYTEAGSWLDVTGGSAGTLYAPWHADATAAFALTNSPLAERFVSAQPTRMIKWLPLGSFTQVRLRGTVVTQSTSASSPRVRLLYKTGAYSETLGAFSAIGASEVSISLTGVGEKDSGWINLVAGAKADCYVGLTELGGDGVLDPALGSVQVYFK